MKPLGSVRRGGRAAEQGFSLIEVLIALVVLAVGLLGLALLQTMNLRYTKSADQRTKAVNLAGSMLDMMRSNRSQAGAYTVAANDFQAVDATSGCGSPDAVGVNQNRTRWICEVVETLGPGAGGTVAFNGATATVVVTWEEDGLPTLDQAGRVELESIL
ncbi:type IV pilus modification protein PilV [Luteimonas yindakuii]|uniref:type IV pilus modification protein PilV n=1 Tax=Luteimonas yindakuii TaxID=2565782 RepID=UPI0014227ADD|nr:type IV pilus modification protein PilV [Luteimonas yindakuii]